MSKELRGHGTVYKRGSTWWIQYCKGGKSYRESAHSVKRQKAVDLLKKRLSESSRGPVIGQIAEKVTLEEMKKTPLIDYELVGNRSVETVTYFTEALLDYFGNSTRALDITGDRITGYMRKRQQDGMSNASINREVACLRHMFNLMVKAGRLSRDHVPSAPRLEEAPPRSGFVEPAEFNKLRNSLPDYLREPASFMYLTGWRKGAVLSLMWARDTELEFADDGKELVGGTVRLRSEHSKNKHAYQLRLKGALLEVFRHAWENRTPECSYIFHKSGEPIGEFRKSWKTACKAAGLQGLLVHDFRRSCARNLVRAGVPERVAMEVTGHKTRSMFDRYNIVAESDLESAMERVTEYVNARAAEKPKVVPLPQEKAA
jgi:integrase